MCKGWASQPPYGEDYNGSGTTADLAFTDQNQDTVKNGWSSNLYDFLMREYRTAHGRWASPDPAGLGAVDPASPQSWNRYAYVMNNPLGMIDPSGLCGIQIYDWQYEVDGNGNVVPGTFQIQARPDGYRELYPGHCNGNPCPGGADLSGRGWFTCHNGPNLIEGADGAGGGAANTATLRQGDPKFWKDYCSHQADLAAVEALLPGITHGDYVPTASKIAREAGAHVALDTAAASTALKYTIRAKTGVPMSVTSRTNLGTDGTFTSFSLAQ